MLVHPDGRLTAVPGGGPFNTARTIARLGGSVAYLGCLSTDRFGAMLRDALTSDGVDLGLTSTSEAPTTLAVAELDERGGAEYRFYTTETAAPALTREAIDAALRTGPLAVHVGTLGLALEPMATVLAAGILTVADEVVVMLDPNCRPSVIPDRLIYLDRLHRILPRMDIVKVSADDLAYLAPDMPPLDAAVSFLERGVSVVLLTDGGRAVSVLTSEVTFDVPVPAVAVVDSVGAGDAFGGAFLARCVERRMSRAGLADVSVLREAVGLAVEVASRTCQRAGADPPRRAELDWPAA